MGCWGEVRIGQDWCEKMCVVSVASPVSTLGLTIFSLLPGRTSVDN